MPRIVRAAILCAVAVAASFAGTASGPADSAYEADAGRCAGADDPVGASGAGDAERAVKCLIEARRDDDSLDRDPRLDDAAASHNRHMLETSCFAHECPGEPSLEGRIRRSGYGDGADRFGYGEILASGSMTPAEAVRAWMDSPAHRDALLDRSFEDVGIAVAKGTPRDSRGSDATYTVDFGSRQG
jgi:uncharacterized protein YkwD